MAEFSLRIEYVDGHKDVIELDFDYGQLDDDSKKRAFDLWDGGSHFKLGAAFLFVNSGLPDSEWESIGPTLELAVAGRVEFEMVDS